MSHKILTVIRPERPEGSYLKECWSRIGIARFLARRDFVVRYRAMIIGLAWVVLRPVLTLLILCVVFGRISALPNFGTPYPVLILIGLMVWQFFASVVQECSNSLVNSPSLITKVAFPKVLVPISSLPLNLVDLAIHSGILALLMVWYGICPTWRMLLLPVSVFLMIAVSLGIGLFGSALMVIYRDFKNIIPIILQAGMLISPVGFSLRAAPLVWQDMLWLNPLAAPIELSRWSLLPGYPVPELMPVTISCILVMLSLVGGYLYFRRSERKFSDVI